MFLHSLNVLYYVLDRPVKMLIGSRDSRAADSVYIQEGDNLTLHCQVIDANPPVTAIEWLHESAPVGSRYTTVEISGGSQLTAVTVDRLLASLKFNYCYYYS